MIAQVGRAEDGNLCIHVQTKRTMFTVVMTPEEGRELVENIIYSIELLCGKKAVEKEDLMAAAREEMYRRSLDCISEANRQLRSAEGFLKDLGAKNAIERISDAEITLTNIMMDVDYRLSKEMEDE